MNPQIAGRRILQWTRSNATSSVLHQAFTRTCHVPQTLSVPYRHYCSSSGQTRTQSSQHQPKVSLSSKQPVRELSPRSLLDMGFTETQADHISETVAKFKGGRAGEQAMSVLSALFILGLNSSSVLKVLEKCPELYHVKSSQFEQRISNLRKLGLVEGSLQRVVAYYPSILTLPVKKVNQAVLFLREKCLFTTQQITDILRDSPAVVQEDQDQLEHKFQYVYFRMGVKQAEMVKSRLFRSSLDHVRCRHCFLERRGQYQTPDKKGQTLIVNPPLSDVFGTNEQTYLARVARAEPEEYEVFQRLLAREWQEDDRQRVTEDGYDSDDDEEDEEEEAMLRRQGYKTRRKR